MPDYKDSRLGGVPLRLMMPPMHSQPHIGHVCAIVNAIYQTAYPEHISLRDEIIDAIALGDHAQKYC